MKITKETILTGLMVLIFPETIAAVAFLVIGAVILLINWHISVPAFLFLYAVLRLAGWYDTKKEARKKIEKQRWLIQFKV